MTRRWSAWCTGSGSAGQDGRAGLHRRGSPRCRREAGGTARPPRPVAWELEFRAQPCEGIGVQTNRRRFAPIDSCLPGIAAFFDCRVWVEQAEGRPLRYVFFGLRGDVAAADYLYGLVEQAFRTE